jgi:hypothetical protein
MPSAIQYTIREQEAVDKAGREESKARGMVIERNWRYYDGDHNQPLKAQRDGYNDNVIINNIEPLADKTVAFLMGDGISFSAGGDNDQTADDDNVNALWQANRGEVLLSDIALGGAIEGHCAVRLMPVEGGFPKIVRIKQSHFTAFWDPFDMSRVLWYRLEYTGGGIGRRIDYVRGRFNGADVDHTQPGWIEVVYQTKEQNGNPFGMADKWELISEPLAWEYDYPPIIDWPNISNPNGYYGKPDVGSAIRLNDALNFILSNLQRIIKHYASPKTIGLGFKASELVGTEVGGFFSVNKPPNEANLFNLEMQSDLKSSMELASIITSGLWQSGGMVDPQTMKDRIGALTNFGLKVLYSDAIKRTDKKRAIYGEALELISQAGLSIAGLAVPDEVEVIWPSVLPADETQQVETLTIELTNGIISKETYRTLRGYDNEKEDDRIAEEKAVNGNVGANILSLMTSNQAFNRGA